MRISIICTLHQVLLGFIQIKEDEIDRTYSMYRIFIKMLVGKPEGKRLFGRCRHRWEDNITINHKEVGSSGGLL
jgi:hypothetical protein